MAKRWIDATDERHWPGPLIDFVYALNRLHLAGHVKADRWIGIIGGSNREWVGPEDTDPKRVQWRNSERKVLDDLRMMTKRIRRLFPSDSETIDIYESLERRRAWRCSRCQTKGRIGARYCDRCGTAKPDEEQSA